jgi:hypothetical protein
MLEWLRCKSFHGFTYYQSVGLDPYVIVYHKIEGEKVYSVVPPFTAPSRGQCKQFGTLRAAKEFSDHDSTACESGRTFAAEHHDEVHRQLYDMMDAFNGHIQSRNKTLNTFLHCDTSDAENGRFDLSTTYLDRREFKLDRLLREAMNAERPDNVPAYAGGFSLRMGIYFPPSDNGWAAVFAAGERLVRADGQWKQMDGVDGFFHCRLVPPAPISVMSTFGRYFWDLVQDTGEFLKYIRVSRQQQKELMGFDPAEKGLNELKH